MTEKFVLAVLLLIYATGCVASIVEIHEQRDFPNAAALARTHPIGNVIVTALMIATWPLVLTWVKVRENWR